MTDTSPSGATDSDTADAGTADATSAVTVLDNRRTPCAVGLIRANDTAARLPVRSVLEIHTRDRFAPVEISLWAKRSGHSDPDISRAGSWPFRYRVFSLVIGGAGSAR